MMLFDIVRDLNDKISYSMNNGRPGKRAVYLTGTTDGYNVVIHFMGETVWDSTEWSYHYEGDDVTEAQVELEMGRIRSHITTKVQKLINQFFSIQLDTDE